MSDAAIDGGKLLLAGSPDDAMGPVYLRYLKQSVPLFLRHAAELPGASPADKKRLVDAVRGALAKDPRAALEAFASPAVGAPLHCFASRESQPKFRAGIDQAFAAAAPGLLLELAVRELLAAPVDWPAAPPLASPTLGVRITPPAGATGWRFENGVLTVLLESGPGPSVRLGASSLARGRSAVRGLRVELAYAALRGRTKLALVDANPIAELEAHPDKSGNALDLGGHSEDDWRESLSTALDWIAGHSPVISEMNLMLSQVVPVGWHAERHLSASYRESIGTVYLTLHPNTLTMAEALIHEFQHNKMNAASYLDPFLHNAFFPLYKSPVRPDPRPLWGILLAVHAFLPIAAFYRALLKADHPVCKTTEFQHRYAEVDLKNREGLDVLRAHAQWTPMGRALMDAMEELDRRHMAERERQGLPLHPTSAHV